MTNKEAIYIINNRLNTYYCTDEDLQALGLAVKALEMVDDINQKVYRNEHCPQKHRCYDYQGYHCAGCSWEKKGGTE